MERETMLPLEPPDRQRLHRASERDERLAARLVIDAAEPFVPVRIVDEVDPHTALRLRDRRLAARAPRLVRSAAAPGRHYQVGHQFPQNRLTPAEGSHRIAAHARSE